VPAVGLEDHVCAFAQAQDSALLGPLIAYLDFECPYCAALHARLAPVLAPGRSEAAAGGAGRGVGGVWVVRHFPSRSRYPRSWPAACAAEAAARQGRFWPMHDLLLGDQGRLEDPHLWERARALELDLERFEADRRGDAARERVQRDFEAAVRAGVATSPTVAYDGRLFAGAELQALLESLGL
jgi:protein-disulfide isomerase